MNKLLVLFVWVFSLQSCENKTINNGEDSNLKKDKSNELTIERDKEIAGSLSVKFDNDNLADDFNIQKNDDELVQSVLLVFLSSQKKSIKLNIINNSVLYNNKNSVYYTSFNVSEKKICTVTIEYPDHESIQNISGEKKNLVEKIKYRFDDKKRKIQVIGYELSYQKDTKFIMKSFNFITGKYIATQKSDGKTSTSDGWAAELENVYAENWNFPFLRDKIFWYGEGVE